MQDTIFHFARRNYHMGDTNDSIALLRLSDLGCHKSELHRIVKIRLVITSTAERSVDQLFYIGSLDRRSIGL